MDEYSPAFAAAGGGPGGGAPGYGAPGYLHPIGESAGSGSPGSSLSGHGRAADDLLASLEHESVSQRDPAAAARFQVLFFFFVFPLIPVLLLLRARVGVAEGPRRSCALSGALCFLLFFLFPFFF